MAGIANGDVIVGEKSEREAEARIKAEAKLKAKEAVRQNRENQGLDLDGPYTDEEFVFYEEYKEHFANYLTEAQKHHQQRAAEGMVNRDPNYFVNMLKAVDKQREDSRDSDKGENKKGSGPTP